MHYCLPTKHRFVNNRTLKQQNKGETMEDDIQMMEQGDSIADAVAAVALILIFVTTCVFWISGQ